MAVNLTAGAISLISSGESQDLKPVFQVTDIRLLVTGGGGGDSKGERYKVLLSDGTFQQQGMLATQRNELVKSHQLQKGSIVQLTEFVCNIIRERVIIIIVDLNVILTECDIIGNPRPFPHKPPGNETPSIATLAAPMQPSVNQQAPMQSSLNHQATMQPSVNQAASTVTNAQFSTADSVNSSVTIPNSNRPSTIHNQIPQQNPGLRSYGNSSNNNFQTGQNNSTRATFTNPQQPVRPAYNQPPQMYGNRGPIGKNEAPARIIPIAALNPYQSKWTIKARVTAKGDLRSYRNAKGEGKVFSFDLLDSDGGEIRATCFNDIADQFYNQIEVGKVFYISKGTIKPAQKAFNHLKNDHEITLDRSSTIQSCFDDDTSIPRQQFHFRSIDEIENMDNNTVLDIIGVVSSITPPSSIHRKNNAGETFKQVLELKDMSGRSISLTLWGNFCDKEGQKLQNMCDSGSCPVLAVKSARVYEFNGKSIGTISSSQLSIDPDYPEASKLKEWFNSVGKNIPSVSMFLDSGFRKTISQIKDEKIGTSEKADVITVNATIWFIKHDTFCYTACPCPSMNGNGKCAKKVVNNGDGKWQCDKCNVTLDECDYRYILQLQLQDHTGLTYSTAFQETGEVIMGVPAKDLYLLKYEQKDDDRFAEIIRNALFNEYSFKLKVQAESYNEEQRVKSIVIKAEKLKFSSYTKTLLSDLVKMNKLEDPRSISPSSGLNPRLGQQAVLPANHVGHSGSLYSGFGGRNNSRMLSGGGSTGSSSYVEWV